MSYPLPVVVIPEDVSNLWGVHLVDEDMEPVDQHFMF